MLNLTNVTWLHGKCTTSNVPHNLNSQYPDPQRPVNLNSLYPNPRRPVNSTSLHWEGTLLVLLHYNVLCLSKSCIYSYTLPSGMAFRPAAGTELSNNSHQWIYFSISFTRVSKINFCSLFPGIFLQTHFGYKIFPVKSHDILHITATPCNYRH